MQTQLYALRNEGTQVTLHVFGKLDVTNHSELRDGIHENLLPYVPNPWGVIVVNLQGLDLIDSSGVSSIVSLYKQARERGGQVHVTGVRGQPLQVFRILRMDKIFGM